jgi:hypothetical protein
MYWKHHAGGRMKLAHYQRPPDGGRGKTIYFGSLRADERMDRAFRERVEDLVCECYPALMGELDWPSLAARLDDARRRVRLAFRVTVGRRSRGVRVGDRVFARGTRTTITDEELARRLARVRGVWVSETTMMARRRSGRGGTGLARERPAGGRGADRPRGEGR